MGGKTASWLSKVFEVNPAGLNWPRAVMVLDVMLVPLVIFWAIGHQEYLLSALFGVLFAALADPGGGYGYRAWHIAVFGLIGAALTALGFGIGGDACGWLVLAAVAVTLLAGLAIAFGMHRFVAAYLLNIWFIIALALASSFHHAAHITSYTYQVPDDVSKNLPAHLCQRHHHDDTHSERLIKAAVPQDMCRRDQPDSQPDPAALRARRLRLPRRDDGAFGDRSSHLMCPVSGGHLDRLRAALAARAPFIPSISEKHCRNLLPR